MHTAESVEENEILKFCSIENCVDLSIQILEDYIKKSKESVFNSQ